MLLQRHNSRVCRKKHKTAHKAGMSNLHVNCSDEDGTLIADTLTGGATTTWGQSARYIYLPTASGPMPVAAIFGTKHYAIQSDHLNTPRRLIQSDGQVAWQWAYSAFGDEKPTVAKTRFANADLSQSFGSTTVPAVTFNLRYPGQYFDQESGLHYNYHRSYSATTGRYTQSDPIGLDGGWNRFGYVGQNPLSFTDPLGLQALRRPPTPIVLPNAANDPYYGGGGGGGCDCVELKKTVDKAYFMWIRFTLNPGLPVMMKASAWSQYQTIRLTYQALCGPYTPPAAPDEPPRDKIDDFYSR
jgi:RHS repeat-associated protein